MNKLRRSFCENVLEGLLFFSGTLFSLHLWFKAIVLICCVAVKVSSL